MIAASSVETEGDNQPIPPSASEVCPQNILLGIHRHQFQKREKVKKKNLCKYTIKCDTSTSNIYEGRKRLQSLELMIRDHLGSDRWETWHWGVCCCSKTIFFPFCGTCLKKQHGKHVRIKPLKRLGGDITTLLTTNLVLYDLQAQRIGFWVCYFQTRCHLIWPQMEEQANQPLWKTWTI